MIDCPAVKEEHWKDADGNSPPHFPGGEYFIAANIDGQIVVWGGQQYNSDLPTDVIYVLTLTRNPAGKIVSDWQVKPALGEVHPGTWTAAFVAYRPHIYIHGGVTENGQYTAALTTLTLAGEFQRIHPVGEIPTARWGHQAFCYDGKIYFLGGETRKKSVGEDSKPNKYGDEITNGLFSFDPAAARFSFFATTGAR